MSLIDHDVSFSFSDNINKRCTEEWKKKNVTHFRMSVVRYHVERYPLIGLKEEGRILRFFSG